MKVEELYDEAFAVAETFVRDGVQVAPALLILHSNGKRSCVEVERFTCVEHKNAVAEFQREAVKCAGVECVAFVCEAWQVHRDAEDARPIERDLDLAPDRIEVVLFSLLGALGRRAIMRCAIDREHATLEKAPFKWLDEMGLKECHGRFIDV